MNQLVNFQTAAVMPPPPPFNLSCPCCRRNFGSAIVDYGVHLRLQPCRRPFHNPYRSLRLLRGDAPAFVPFAVAAQPPPLPQPPPQLPQHQPLSEQERRMEIYLSKLVGA